MEEIKLGVEESLRPPCKMIGEDGNVYLIISRVRKALKNAGMDNKGIEFANRAMAADSYDAVLQMMFEYVDVE